MMERTFVLIKPDAVKRNLIGKIIAEYEERELVISEIRMMTATKERVRAHYSAHEGKPFFDKIVNYLSSGPVVALVFDGEEAVQRVRQINGATDPKEADQQSIRGKYGLSSTENSVHASDSLANAEDEIELWLGI